MLRGYHKTPAGAKNSPVGKANIGKVGLELEFMPYRHASRAERWPLGEGQVAENRLASYLEDALFRAGMNPSWFVFERDGSLSDGNVFGVEMISRPGGYAFWLNQPWDEFFRLLETEKVVELGHEYAGMHLHVDAFRPSEAEYSAALWHRTATMDWRDFEFFFGRIHNEFCGYDIPMEFGVDDDEDWCEICGPAGLADTIRGNSDTIIREYRYAPINLTGKRTAEYRMFPSPSSGEQVRKAIRFARETRYPGIDLARKMTNTSLVATDVMSLTSLKDGFAD
jgi:hypothetical protein